MTNSDPVELPTRQISVEEINLKSLHLPNTQLELNAPARIVNLLSTDSPHVLAQEQFTKNEWCVLLCLFAYYPQYAPYEVLLASLTLLSITDCRKKIHKAQEAGGKALKQELSPVHRALASVRKKLASLSPHLRVSVVRDSGYLLMITEE